MIILMVCVATASPEHRVKNKKTKNDLFIYLFRLEVHMSPPTPQTLAHTHLISFARLGFIPASAQRNDRNYYAHDLNFATQSWPVSPLQADCSVCAQRERHA